MTELQQPVTAADIDDEISLLDLLQVIAENLKLLVLGPIVAGLIALGISYTITPTYTAVTTFLPPQQQQSSAAAMLQSLGALSGIAGAAAGIKNPADQYVALTGSRSVEDAMVDRFKLTERYEVKLRQDARRALKNNTRISGGKSGLITLEVDDKEPEVAAAIANAYVEELSKLLGRLALTEAQGRRAFFEGQLKKARDGLVVAETALKAVGVGASAVKSSPNAAVGAVATLMAQVSAKQVQIGAMRGYLAESAPEFKRAQTELTALRSQLERAEKDGNGNGGGDYVARYRDFKYHEVLFELMAKQFEVARIDESREGALIQIVDQAVSPEFKSKPKKAYIAVLAAAAAGFVLLVFVFVRDGFSRARQKPGTAAKLEAIRSALPGARGRPG